MAAWRPLFPHRTFGPSPLNKEGRTYIVLGLLSGITSQSLLGQWPRCNVLNGELGSIHSCAKTFFEALGRIGPMETGEAARGRFFTASADSRIAEASQEAQRALA